MKSNYFFAVGILLVIVFYSCQKAPSTFSTSGGNLPTHYINILDSSFSPNDITLSIGSSITFLNSTTINHTIISDDSAALVTTTILPFNSYFYKKDTVGVINYHCKEHPAVRGRIEFRF
jgi:plastocyanin